MTRCWSKLWRGILFAVLLAGSGRELLAVPTSLRKEPQPLPREVVRAWQQAGARVGWLGKDTWGFGVFQEQPEGLTDVVPAFLLTDWPAAGVGQLPTPEAPFGLRLWAPR